MCMVWCEVEYVGMKWSNGVPRCGMIWSELWCDGSCAMCMWNVVQCCIMQDVESYEWCEMWWCGIVVMKNVAYAMCCAIVVWRQIWKMMQCVAMSDVVASCKIKMWWYNAMWYIVWNILCCWMWVWCWIVVDMEWCEMWTVWCGNALCSEMWWCEMVVGGRLRCNAMSDVEYGGPRWDVLWH